MSENQNETEHKHEHAAPAGADKPAAKRKPRPAAPKAEPLSASELDYLRAAHQAIGERAAAEWLKVLDRSREHIRERCKLAPDALVTLHRAQANPIPHAFSIEKD